MNVMLVSLLCSEEGTIIPFFVFQKNDFKLPDYLSANCFHCYFFLLIIRHLIVCFICFFVFYSRLIVKACCKNNLIFNQKNDYE